MDNIEEQILHYPGLSPEGREAVEAYVAEHPHWQGLLHDVKALEHVLGQARALGAAVPPAEVLAHYLVTPRTGALPPALREAFERVEAALEDEEQGKRPRAQLRAMKRRLRALEAESSTPLAHFEALTGHTFEEEEDAGPAAAAGAASAQGQGREATEHARRASRVRFFLRLAFLPRWARYAASLVLSLAVLYGALFAGSRLTQPRMERLASLGGDRLSIEGYGMQGMRMRGGSPPPADSASLDARYLRSLRLLRGARTTTLGLFPRYDDADLHRAERQLDAVAREAEGGSFMQLEALFFLGKARLALGDKAGATGALRQVVLGNGRLAPEAQDLLEALYADAAYDGPPAGG